MYDYPEYPSDNDNYNRYEDINQHCLLLDQARNGGASAQCPDGAFLPIWRIAKLRAT